jgi:hypothetical protein
VVGFKYANRESSARQSKLNQLLRALQNAQDAFIDREGLEEEDQI